MNTMKTRYESAEFVERLKQHYPAMYLVQTVIQQTGMRLREVLDVDSQLSVDCQTGIVRVWSRKTRSVRMVVIEPKLAEDLTALLGEPTATRAVMIARALQALGPSYRRWLSILRARKVSGG